MQLIRIISGAPFESKQEKWQFGIFVGSEADFVNGYQFMGIVTKYDPFIVCASIASFGIQINNDTGYIFSLQRPYSLTKDCN